jgi:CHAT domain-containing protein
VTRCVALALVLLGSTHMSFAQPQTLIEQGQRAFQKGAFSQAATDWKQAQEGFRSKGDIDGEIQASLLLAGAFQAIGQQRRAVQILEETLTRAERAGNAAQVALVKSKLGGAFVITRESDRAAILLREALDSARTAKDARLTAAILNDLGNLSATDQKHAEALAAYTESASLARLSTNRLLTAQALCNAAAAAARASDFAKAQELNGEALREIAALDDASYQKAFLFLTSGQADRLIQLTDATAAKQMMLRAHGSFEKALEIGEKINSLSIQTYALGYMGQLYEDDKQLDPALTLTRRARFAAQQAQMPEAMYRWEWQTGRLLRKRGDMDGAIAAYRQAVETLEPIRGDVSLGYGNVAGQSTFRETDGPLFFELADLLLQQAKAANDPQREQTLLREARDTVEHLKAVELQNYFCDECVDVQRLNTRGLESVDERSAVVYLIPLQNRTEVLVGTRSGLKRFTVDASSDALTAEVREFRQNLETRTTYGYLAQAQRLYDWLIRPIRPALAAEKIHTLVIVPDGALRTIPFASLHDGDKFLIEDMAVAVAPGLSLVAPQALERGKTRLLLNGLSKSVQGYAPLDFVTNELRSIDPNSSSPTLLNEDFTLAQLKRRLTDEQFSIVHIASHGEFNRDVRNTFVLTYDTRLTLNDLEALIRPSQYRGQPVELLVLSACQTAAGDDRAALGLAGVALKAGARSALASLWFVNDQSTSALISEVYAQLRQSPTVSKAQAVQAAQVKMLRDRRYRHPCYWSPYLIIGNWL